MTDRGIHKVVKIIAVLVLLPLSIIIPTLSLESYYAPTISAQSTQTNSTNKNFSERKKQYLAQFGEELNEGQEQRIKLRCLAVQANIKTLADRIAEVQTKRKTAYDSIIADVKTLTDGLKNQAFDASNLEQNTKELEDKLSAYQKNISSYKQALEDLTVIDCSQDPATFKAALQAARRTHANLIGQVADIRAYILNTLKPTMQQVREELVSQQAAGVSS